jgi:DNA-binding transcriptional ArsR family regulator
MNKSKKVNRQVLERQVRICKAFANTTRLQMLDLLGRREWPVSELKTTLRISKHNLSQHLAILRSAGIVQTRREGRQLHCSLAIPEVKSACQIIGNVLRAQIRRSKKLDV